MDTASEVEKSAEPCCSENVQPVAEKPKPIQETKEKRSRKEEKMQKKDDKVVDQFLKSLSHVGSTEEKLNIACKKYAEFVEENRRLKASMNQSDKKNGILTKEKEQLQLEYNRTVLVKAKLENLCRELQKQNKTVKEESLQKIREEELRRKETQAKFQSTLTEITSLLQVNSDKNSKLRDDNINMTNKFKSVVEQYELREQQVEKMAKQMSLEQQLAEAKLAKAHLEAQAEREKLLSEMAQLKLELNHCQAKIMDSQGTEVALRNQLSVYTEKYDEFQNALVKSNKVFGGFKEEMEKMSKKIVKLEKESMEWKKKWEASQIAMLEMATEKQGNDGKTQNMLKQIAQLQKLCRTMQTERSLLLNTLKAAGISPPPLPPPTPAPPQSNDRIDTMAANCAQLKQSLAQLQTQLNVLTTNKNEEEAPKTEKPKKNKNKKKKNGEEAANPQANARKEPTDQTQSQPEEVQVTDSTETPKDDVTKETSVTQVDNNQVDVTQEIVETKNEEKVCSVKELSTPLIETTENIDKQKNTCASEVVNCNDLALNAESLDEKILKNGDACVDSMTENVESLNLNSKNDVSDATGQ